MKKYILVILLFLLPLTFFSKNTYQWNSSYQSYINEYKDLAIEEMLKYHIPASITLAQGLFESRAGLSNLAKNGNNHFGIKCHDWTGATIKQDDDDIGECFRAYDNAYDSFEDHCKFLKENVRYSKLFKLNITDYKGWAKGLSECGYATNPNYAYSIINIIELYRLYEFDTANNYDKFIVDHSVKCNTNKNDYKLHPIHIYNDNYYIKARNGDTYKSIGKEVEISYKKIAKYNEQDRDAILHEGDIVYLKKKRIKSAKIFKDHPYTVKPGDSMYSISQLYGIRIKSLYKINHLDYDYNIKVGDILYVY
jgi:LysM repeat protein